jgi:4'-phosphopantetheinyl transferase
MNGLEVHVFSLDGDVPRLAGLLTPDELERAARFRFDRDRNRYIVCRGTLRELLGVTGRFVYGPYGKPRLEGSEIRFNVSHSHGLGMIAIAQGREVGCDIERIEQKFADEQIPERFFSPAEVAALRALPEPEQCEAFFRCWTRKEAFIKACGMGVSLPLDSFDVTLGRRAALLRGAEGWFLRAVDAPEGYAAALVLKDLRRKSRPSAHDHADQFLHIVDEEIGRGVGERLWLKAPAYAAGANLRVARSQHVDSAIADHDRLRAADASFLHQ